MRPPYEIPQIVAELTPAFSSARSICTTNESKPRRGSMREPLPGSPASEKLRTRNVRASSSTVGRAHSQRPCIPGISTSGGPLPTSIISFCHLLCSISEHFHRDGDSPPYQYNTRLNS